VAKGEFTALPATAAALPAPSIASTASTDPVVRSQQGAPLAHKLDKKSNMINANTTYLGSSTSTPRDSRISSKQAAAAAVTKTAAADDAVSVRPSNTMSQTPPQVQQRQAAKAHITTVPATLAAAAAVVPGPPPLPPSAGASISRQGVAATATVLVRQCQKCQVLFVNGHVCD
jgi:hypothetical protein